MHTRSELNIAAVIAIGAILGFTYALISLIPR